MNEPMAQSRVLALDAATCPATYHACSKWPAYDLAFRWFDLNPSHTRNFMSGYLSAAFRTSSRWLVEFAMTTCPPPCAKASIVLPITPENGTMFSEYWGDSHGLSCAAWRSPSS